MYSLAGYVAKRLISHCDGCRDLLSAGRMECLPVIDAANQLTTEEIELKEKFEFLKMISRGGLLNPTDEMFTACRYATAIYMKLTNTEENKKLLISGTVNPRNVYVDVFVRKLEEMRELEMYQEPPT